MKRAIVANADGSFISALVPKATAPTLHKGDRLRVLASLDLRPYAVVSPGMEGTVTFVDFETGQVELVLDEPIPGLKYWDNCILLTPYETDDLLKGLMRTDSDVGLRRTG